MKVFVLRTAALGDLVLTLPVLSALRSLGQVFVATHARFVPLLPEGVTRADDAWVWSGGAHDYDVGVAFTATAADALRRAGVPEVRWVDPRPPHGVHAVDHYAQVLHGLAYDPIPRVAPPDAPFGAPFVVIAPGSGGREKCWPIEAWRSVAERLPVAVTWVRGPVEAEQRSWPAASIPDVEGLISLASRASAWLGPDSGPGHVAAAVLAAQGRHLERCSVIFGPTDPACWAPRGARVWLWDADPAAIAAHVQRFLRNADG